MEFEDREFKYNVNIKIVGVGGGGNNAIAHMIKNEMKGVEFWALNTDAQTLAAFDKEHRIYLGQNLTKGLGSGADPDVGRKACEESLDAIKAALRGADMVFIAAGMGGGTGTGASPIIAKAARELGALTVAVVTTPFGFEGTKRRSFAQEGLQELRANVDSIIVVSNETLLQMFGNLPMYDAFTKANDILCQSVHAITSLVTEKSVINLDFADIKNVMKDKGSAIIGMGKGYGENKAKEAATQAISSPLLGTTLRGAKNAIINISGGRSVTLQDANEAVEIVREVAGDNINIIFGVSLDEHRITAEEDQNYMIVTVIATEFSNTNHSKFSYEPNLEVSLDGLKLPKSSVNVVNNEELTSDKEENEVHYYEEESNDLDFSLPSFLKRR